MPYFFDANTLSKMLMMAGAPSPPTTDDNKLDVSIVPLPRKLVNKPPKAPDKVLVVVDAGKFLITLLPPPPIAPPIKVDNRFQIIPDII